MSTLSGIAAKGEKGKARYQLLDINNLFHANRGESSEPHQHKNISSRRHGMQSLGKVLTSARRRAPANLPSLKSEYSGNDPAISLVPSGGSGWGNKPGETGPPPSTTQVSTSSTPSATTVTSAQSTTVTAPVTSPAPTAVSAPALTPIASSTSVTSATASGGDKSWSSITSSGTESSPMFLGHQSIYFQQEFPSLSGDASAAASGQNKTDPTHLPGPSLRPQTEGSWMQGGSRPQTQTGAGHGSQQATVPAQGPHHPQGLDVSGGRSNLGPSGAGVAPGGPPASVAPHYRLMPQFMMKHSHPPGNFPTNIQHGSRSRPHPSEARFTPPNRGPSNIDQEEVTSRPIIKEEDLKVMDEIARDTGWAAHDEIDYNQRLTFGDEEGVQDNESKSKNYRQSIQIVDKREADNKNSEIEKPLDYEDKANRKISRESMVSQSESSGSQRTGWQQRPQDYRQAAPQVVMGFQSQQPRLQNHLVKQVEDDEVLQERRRMMNKREIAIAAEKAKQRKEEEEKRFEETRQAAARKLKMLEDEMEKRKGEKENASSVTVNVSHGANAILPEWEKEKSRSRTNSEDKDDKSLKELGDVSKNTQMDNRGGFGRDRERERDRESRPERETGGQPFSRQFQSNLPPRFQKQVADRPTPYYRQSSGGSPQPPLDKWLMGQATTNFGGHVSNLKNNDSNTPDRDRDDVIDNIRDRDRITKDVLESHDNRYEKSEIPEESNMEKEYRFYEDSRDMVNKSNDSLRSNSMQEEPFDDKIFVRENKTDNERREMSQKSEFRDRPDRPQRPDSRDSRASRDSRNSKESIREEKRLLEENFKDSWADSNFDADHIDDKHRKDVREEREPRREMHSMQTYIQRHIPGPITKEKLEASELRCDSTRNINLVPLVRGDKKPEIKKSENQWETGGSSADAWQRTPRMPTPPSAVKTDSWADMTSSAPSIPEKTEQSPDEAQREPIESQQPKIALEESNKNLKSSTQDRESIEPNHKTELQKDKISGGNRGGNRGMRHDSRAPRQNWGSGYYRGGPPPWRATERGGRRPMGGNRRQPHGSRGSCGERRNSESDASADEISVSTESGKEEKRLDQDRKHGPRSPKQGSKRIDKDDRRENNRRIDMDKDGYHGNDNRQYDKRAMYDSHQVGIGPQPRGEPSRRGRGSAPFRSKGTSSNTSRMIDGYGLPTSKKPFTSDSSAMVHDDKKSELQNQMLNKDEMTLEDKMKMNQQQLSAGIIGNSPRLGNFKPQSSSFPPRLHRKSEGERKERNSRDASRRLPRGSVKSGSGSGGEGEDWETTSESSELEARDPECEDERQNDSKKNFQGSKGLNRRNTQLSSKNIGKEKRSGGYEKEGIDLSRRSTCSGPQPVVNGNMRYNRPSATNRDQQDPRHDQKPPRNDSKEKRNNLDRIDLCNTASVVVIDDQPEGTVEEDQTVFATDNNGFQEVRSKKNVKDTNRLKEEPPKGSKERMKGNKPQSSQSPGPPVSSSAPPNKMSHDRQRPSKLPPRLAKQKEMNRMNKMGQQYDVTELNKINQGMSVFPVKDLTSPAPPPPVNAWDKPITALRTSTPPAAPTSGPLPDQCNMETNDHSAASSQRSSPSEDKSVAKLSRELSEKAVLDGTSPPVQTIIFENTNYKSAPVDVAVKSKYNNPINKNPKHDKGRERKLEEESVSLGFKSPGPDMKLQDTKNEQIQMPLAFKNEDNADMKLDFRFDSELTQLTEDKSNKSITAIQMTRTIQQMSSQSSAADLQIKLASVKKVWENPSVVLEHGGEDGSNPPPATTYTPSFGNTVEDSASYGKPGVAGVDAVVGDDGSSLAPEVVYSSGQQLQNNPTTYNGSTVPNMMKTDPSSNVCKVKPQPQSTLHHSHHTAGPLSPPASVFNSSPVQPSPHISYQPAAPYGGISAIPSPPAVFTPQAELYQTFQISSPQVLGSQGRSQFSQFGPYQLPQSLSQSTGFSQQSMYLHQTAPPPPPPSAAPPEIFQTQLSHSYRIQQPAFGNTQQLGNNPNTMLISSSNNSLMSSSVKPSSQTIGAIGTKGASYQTTSQPPPSPLYIYPDPQLLSQSQFMQNSTLVQRPGNNMVPTMPPSSASYYSTSTGGGATGFYQPGNSSMQAAAHPTTYNIQQFNSPSAAATPPGMGSFGSTFLSNGLQMAQQYRSTAPSYLKSAADHQDVLSVFSSPAAQVNSPKSRTTGNGGGGGCGKPGGPNGASQQQPSPTAAHHKFNPYQQNVSATTQLMIQQQQQRGNMNIRGTARYPAPIQRPGPVTSYPRHHPPYRAPHPSRFKQPTAAAATPTQYFVTHSNTTKLENAGMETKSEVTSGECENSKSSNTNKSSEVANEDPKSTND